MTEVPGMSVCIVIGRFRWIILALYDWFYTIIPKNKYNLMRKRYYLEFFRIYNLTGNFYPYLFTGSEINTSPFITIVCFVGWRKHFKNGKPSHQVQNRIREWESRPKRILSAQNKFKLNRSAFHFYCFYLVILPAIPFRPSTHILPVGYLLMLLYLFRELAKMRKLAIIFHLDKV